MTRISLRDLSPLLLLSVACLLSACGSDGSALAVSVRTDMVPGVEFSRVDTLLLEATEPGTATSTLAQKRLMIGRQNDFGAGVRVASFDELSPGELVVLVQLVDSRGAVVVERRTRLNLASDFAVSVILTRDCAGVMCPSPGGAPLFAACVAGRCVDERCQPEAPEFCPEYICDPTTNDVSACPDSADCADRLCASGICLYPTKDPSMCNDTEWCDPFSGCTPLTDEILDGGPGMDADSPDGGDDASMSDASENDASDASLEDAASIEDSSMDAPEDDAATSDASMSDDAGIVCMLPTLLCDDACRDIRTDVHHCGDCGVDCTVLPHVDGASVACASGVCQFGGACVAPYEHCTSVALDGCETDLSDAMHCGDCSTACTGSAPICSSDAEGHYACASGCSAAAPTLCGSTCVNIGTNAAACGGCGNACPTSEHGRAVCSSSTCSIVCDAGYHLCGDTCVSNYDPNSCGARCSACSDVGNGYATCDGTNCGFACDAGFHACGSVCVDNTSLSSCGSSCTTCPGAPAFGTATCDGFVCDFVCLTGYHRCGDSCVRDDSTTGCGAACLTCSAPPSNGTAQCISGTCTSTCNAGYHACGGACSSDTDPTHCGASCTLCPSPSGGFATCSSGVCGTGCPTGWHLCGSACMQNTSTASCGTSSCTACTVPANGTATCNGTACGFTCNTGYIVTGSTCDLPAPLPVWPMSSQVVTSRTPTFGWTLVGMTTGADIQLCNDRACSSVISTNSVTGSSFTPLTALPASRVVYWRLRARLGSAVANGYSSTVWQITTGALSASISSTAGDALRDVNGDGYADIVIGAPTLGRAYVYHGHAGTMPSTTPDATLDPLVAGGYFGENVSICDINGDGYADVVSSQSMYASNNGRVHAYYGSPSGVNTTVGTTIEAPSGLVGRRFGYLVDCAGDMNGDGFGDVLVTAIVPSPTAGGYVYAGSATGLGTTPAKIGAADTSNYLSRAIDSADVNGDGFSDAVVQAGGPWACNFLYGGAGWVSAFPSSLGGIPTYGSCAVGDHNGDGYADAATMWIYGATGMRMQSGSSTGIPVATFTHEFTLPIPPDMLLPPRMIYMDANNDGYEDLIYGEPQGPEGRVFMHHGSATGVALTPSQTITNPTFSGNFGFSVGNAGDVDGDGRNDLVIGTGTGEVAYLYVAEASGFFSSAPAATFTNPSMSSSSFGFSIR